MRALMREICLKKGNVSSNNLAAPSMYGFVCGATVDSTVSARHSVRV